MTLRGKSSRRTAFSLPPRCFRRILLDFKSNLWYNDGVANRTVRNNERCPQAQTYGDIMGKYGKLIAASV